MPKENEKKTKSAPKIRRKPGEILSITTALIIIILALILSVIFVVEKAGEVQKTNQEEQCEGVKLEKGCYRLETAQTKEARIKGLSGRDSLGEKSGMLFVFDTLDKQCIWMKDMKFNLDIIWLNENKQVEKILPDVSPDTYPDSFCSNNTKYVLEFNKNVAQDNGLKLGSTLQF